VSRSALWRMAMSVCSWRMSVHARTRTRTQVRGGPVHPRGWFAASATVAKDSARLTPDAATPISTGPHHALVGRCRSAGGGGGASTADANLAGARAVACSGRRNRRARGG
jgi:hypothetical protein